MHLFAKSFKVLYELFCTDVAANVNHEQQKEDFFCLFKRSVNMN